MNFENSTTFHPYKLLFNLTDKIDLWRGGKSAALSKLSTYYKWKNIKKLYKNNNFKKSAPIWNDKFGLPDGSYSISDIQDTFQIYYKKYMKHLLIILQ